MFDKHLAVEKIIDKFNFINIHKAMEATNWTYHDGFDTPTVDRLKSLATDLLTRVANGEASQTSTGGFSAYYDEKDDVMGLDFTLESFNTGFLYPQEINKS